MNILFIRKFTNLDGTHTLFVRMAKELSGMGHKVFFLLFRGGEGPLSEEIGRYAEFIRQEDLLLTTRLPRIDVIHGIMEGDLLWWSYWYLKNRLFMEAKIVIGFYHPRVFWEPYFPIPSLDKLFYRWFFARIPSENLLFMNEQVKKAHELYFQRTFSRASVIPIPVSVPEQFSVRKNVRRNKIVSIGRLVDFKNYVEYLIEVLRSLRQNGYDMELHVYGDGLLRRRIEDKIASAGMEDRIFLLGEIKYDQVLSVLSDAFLFVGMGTSIIEASGQGIPSLLAIESNNDATTYGWFFQQQGYHVGEQVEGWGKLPMGDLIRYAYDQDDKGYDLLSIKSWEKARIFSSRELMTQYCRFVEEADPSFTIRLGPLRRGLLRIGRQPFKLVRYFYNRTKYGQG